MNAKILKVGLRIRDMIQSLTPIQNETRPGKDIPPDTRPHAGQGIGERTFIRERLDIPGLPDVHKNWDFENIHPESRAKDGNPTLKGEEERIVPDKSIFPVPSYRKSSPHGKLFQREQIAIGKLEVHPAEELDSGGLKPFRPLKLPQPSEELARGNRTFIRRGIQGINTDAEARSGRQDLTARAVDPILTEPQGRNNLKAVL